MVQAQTLAMITKSGRYASGIGSSTPLKPSLTFFQKVSAYDEDASLTVDYLLSLPTCTGRIGATGMCLGGHLAYRCALDKRVTGTVCYFATDIHSHTLGAGGDDSLERSGDIQGELVMIFGKKDNHVPPAGRDLIRRALHEKGVCFSFYEVAHAQRKRSFPSDR